MTKRPLVLANWSEAFVAKQQQLGEPLWWFPYPFLLAIGLVLVLTGHLVFATNPRMGHPASLINFPAEPRRDSALWFSMTPLGHDIVITTNDRQVFRWPQQLTSLEATRPFVKYLRRRVGEEIDAAALLKQASTTQTMAVIAADQRLKYLHLRPVLAALAEAGISSYAFETQIIATASPKGTHASPGAQAAHAGGHATE